MVRELIGFLFGVLATTFVFRMFDINLETGADFVLSFVLTAAAVIALSINRSSLQHQKELRRWEINKEPLIKLATSLSDTIGSTDRSITSLLTGRGDKHDEEIFNRLRTSLQYALDVHVTLLGPQVIQAINKYREEDKAIQDEWDSNSTELIDMLEKSSTIQKDLLKSVNSAISAYAAL